MGKNKAIGGYFGALFPTLNVSWAGCIMYLCDAFFFVTFPTIYLIGFEFYWGAPITVWSVAFAYLCNAIFSWWLKPRIRLNGNSKGWSKTLLVNVVRRGEQTHFWSGTVAYCVLTVWWAIFIGFNQITSGDDFPVSFSGNEELWIQRGILYFTTAVVSLCVLLFSVFDHNTRLGSYYALSGGVYKELMTLTPIPQQYGTAALNGVLTAASLPRSLPPGPMV